VEKEDSLFDALPSHGAYQPDGLLWLDSEIELATGQLQDPTDTFITDGNVASPRVGSEGVDESANIPQRRRVRPAEDAARAGDAQ
jgi:hypothetical protein